MTSYTDHADHHEDHLYDVGEGHGDQLAEARVQHSDDRGYPDGNLTVQPYDHTQAGACRNTSGLL